MLEKQLAGLLAAYLSRFIENVNAEQLGVSLWSGDVVLNNVHLRPDILDQVADLLRSPVAEGTCTPNSATSSFNLSGDGEKLRGIHKQLLLFPLTVVKGLVRQLTITLPWTALDSQPIAVKISGVELVLGPLRTRPYNGKEEQAREEAIKDLQLRKYEKARQQRSVEDGDQPPAAAEENNEFSQSLFSSSWLSAWWNFDQLSQTILQNIDIDIEALSISYVFDYDTLHPSLASACAAFVEKVSINSATKHQEEMPHNDAAAPLCKTITLDKVIVGIFAVKQARNEASLSSVDEEMPHSSISSSKSLGATNVTFEHFQKKWAFSSPLLKLEKTALDVQFTLPGVFKKDTTITDAVRPSPTSTTELFISALEGVEVSASFAAVQVLESLWRSYQGSLGCTSYRKWLHLLKDSSGSLLSSLILPSHCESHESWQRPGIARRRWSFAVHCIVDDIRRKRQTLSRGDSRGPALLHAMVTFSKLRREYCQLWKRRQNVYWAPPLKDLEQKKLDTMERQLNLPQVIFLRCLARGELAFELDATSRQQRIIDDVRQRQDEEKQMKGDKGARGVWGWLRRLANESETENSAKTRGRDTENALESVLGWSRATSHSVLLGDFVSLAASVEAEWLTGRDFVSLQELPLPKPHVPRNKLADWAAKRELFFTLQVQCQSVVLRFDPVYWPLNHDSSAPPVPTDTFLSRLKQSFVAELEMVEILYTTVPTAGADGDVSFSLYIGSAAMQFVGSFQTYLLKSKEAGDEDWLTVKQNSKRDHVDVILAPQLIICHPLHEWQWWCNEIMIFHRWLQDVKELFYSRSFHTNGDENVTTSSVISREVSVETHCVAEAATVSSTRETSGLLAVSRPPVDLSWSIVIQEFDVCMPLFSCDVTNEDLQVEDCVMSTSSFLLCDSAATIRPNDINSSPSWSPQNPNASPGPVAEDTDESDFYRAMTANQDGSPLTRNSDSSVHKPDRCFLGNQACLILSLAKTRIAIAPAPSRSGDSDGREYNIRVGSSTKAIRLFCQKGYSTTIAPGRQLELASFLAAEVTIRPVDVVILFKGIEVILEPQAFAMIQDHLTKPSLSSLNEAVRRHYQQRHTQRPMKAFLSHLRGVKEPGQTVHDISNVPWKITVGGHLVIDSINSDDAAIDDTWATVHCTRYLAASLYDNFQKTSHSTLRDADASARLPPQYQALHLIVGSLFGRRRVSFGLHVARLLVRSELGIDVAELVMIAPDCTPNATPSLCDAFPLVHGAHQPLAVEMVLCSCPTFGIIDDGTPTIFVARIPDITMTTASGEKLINVEQLTVHYSKKGDEDEELEVCADSLSVCLEMELVHIIEYGIATQRSFFPRFASKESFASSSQHPESPLQSSAVGHQFWCSLPNITLKVWEVELQLPLTKADVEIAPLVEVDVRATSLQARVITQKEEGEGGAHSKMVHMSITIVEATQEVDYVGGDPEVRHLVSSSNAEWTQVATPHLTCEATLHIPLGDAAALPGNGATPLVSAEVAAPSCNLDIYGGSVHIYFPFVYLYIEAAMKDERLQRIWRLSKPECVQRGFTHAVTLPLTDRPTMRSIWNFLSLEGSISHVQLLVASDANTPILIEDGSSFLAVYLEKLTFGMQRTLGMPDKVATVSHKATLQNSPSLRTRVVLDTIAVQMVTLHSSSGKTSLLLPNLKLRAESDVVLIPKENYAGFSFMRTPQSGSSLLIGIQQVEDTVGGSKGNEPAARSPQSSAIELRLSPLQCQLLTRVLLYNAFQPPVTRAGNSLSVDNLEGSSDKTVPPSPTPALTLLFTLPPVSFTLDASQLQPDLLYQLVIGGGMQLYSASGGQWTESPVKNLQLRGLALRVAGTGVPHHHGTAPSSPGSKAYTIQTSESPESFDLATVEMVGLAILEAKNDMEEVGRITSVKIAAAVRNVSLSAPRVQWWTQLMDLITTSPMTRSASRSMTDETIRDAEGGVAPPHGKLSMPIQPNPSHSEYSVRRAIHGTVEIANIRLVYGAMTAEQCLLKLLVPQTQIEVAPVLYRCEDDHSELAWYDKITVELLTCPQLILQEPTGPTHGDGVSVSVLGPNKNVSPQQSPFVAVTILKRQYRTSDMPPDMHYGRGYCVTRLTPQHHTTLSLRLAHLNISVPLGTTHFLLQHVLDEMKVLQHLLPEATAVRKVSRTYTTFEADLHQLYFRILFPHQGNLGSDDASKRDRNEDTWCLFHVSAAGLRSSIQPLPILTPTHEPLTLIDDAEVGQWAVLGWNLVSEVSLEGTSLRLSNASSFPWALPTAKLSISYPLYSTVLCVLSERESHKSDDKEVLHRRPSSMMDVFQVEPIDATMFSELEMYFSKTLTIKLEPLSSSIAEPAIVVALPLLVSLLHWTSSVVQTWKFPSTTNSPSSVMSTAADTIGRDEGAVEGTVTGKKVVSSPGSFLEMSVSFASFPVHLITVPPFASSKVDAIVETSPKMNVVAKLQMEGPLVLRLEEECVSASHSKTATAGSRSYTLLMSPLSIHDRRGHVILRLKKSTTTMEAAMEVRYGGAAYPLAVDIDVISAFASPASVDFVHVCWQAATLWGLSIRKQTSEPTRAEEAIAQNPTRLQSVVLRLHEVAVVVAPAASLIFTGIQSTCQVSKTADRVVVSTSTNRVETIILSPATAERGMGGDLRMFEMPLGASVSLQDRSILVDVPRAVVSNSDSQSFFLLASRLSAIVSRFQHCFGVNLSMAEVKVASLLEPTPLHDCYTIHGALASLELRCYHPRRSSYVQLLAENAQIHLEHQASSYTQMVSGKVASLTASSIDLATSSHLGAVFRLLEPTFVKASSVEACPPLTRESTITADILKLSLPGDAHLQRIGAAVSEVVFQIMRWKKWKRTKYPSRDEVSRNLQASTSASAVTSTSFSVLLPQVIIHLKVEQDPSPYCTVDVEQIAWSIRQSKADARHIQSLQIGKITGTTTVGQEDSQSPLAAFCPIVVLCVGGAVSPLSQESQSPVDYLTSTSCLSLPSPAILLCGERQQSSETDKSTRNSDIAMTPPASTTLAVTGSIQEAQLCISVALMKQLSCAVFRPLLSCGQDGDPLDGHGSQPIPLSSMSHVYFIRHPSAPLPTVGEYAEHAGVVRVIEIEDDWVLPSDVLLGGSSGGWQLHFSNRGESNTITVRSEGNRKVFLSLPTFLDGTVGPAIRVDANLTVRFEGVTFVVMESKVQRRHTVLPNAPLDSYADIGEGSLLCIPPITMETCTTGSDHLPTSPHAQNSASTTTQVSDTAELTVQCFTVDVQMDLAISLTSCSELLTAGAHYSLSYCRVEQINTFGSFCPTEESGEATVTLQHCAADGQAITQTPMSFSAQLSLASTTEVPRQTEVVICATPTSWKLPLRHIRLISDVVFALGLAYSSVPVSDLRETWQPPCTVNSLQQPTASARRSPLRLTLSCPFTTIVIPNDFGETLTRLSAKEVTVLCLADAARTQLLVEVRLTVVVEDRLSDGGGVAAPSRILLSATPHLTFSSSTLGMTSRSTSISLNVDDVVVTLPVTTAVRLVRDEWGEEGGHRRTFWNQTGLEVALHCPPTSLSLGVLDGTAYKILRDGERVSTKVLPSAQFIELSCRESAVRSLESSAHSFIMENGGTVAGNFSAPFVKVDMREVGHGTTSHVALPQFLSVGALDLVLSRQIVNHETILCLSSCVELQNALQSSCEGGDVRMASKSKWCVPLESSAYAPIPMLSKPFFLSVGDFVTEASSAILTWAAIVDAFGILHQTRTMRGSYGASSPHYAAAQKKLYQWCDAATEIDASTLVTPILLRKEGTNIEENAKTSAKVVKLVWRRNTEPRSQRRHGKQLLPFRITISVEPVWRVWNYTGCRLQLNLLHGSPSTSTAVTKAAGKSSVSAIVVATVDAGACFEWFPSSWAVMQCDVHMWFAIAPPCAELTDETRQKMWWIAATTVGLRQSPPSFVRLQCPSSPVEGAVRLETRGNSTLIIKSAANLVSKLKVPVYVHDAAQKTPLMGVVRSLVKPGYTYPLFYSPYATASVLHMDRVRFTVATTEKSGQASQPFVVTTPLTPAFLQSSDGQTSSFFAASPLSPLNSNHEAEALEKDDADLGWRPPAVPTVVLQPLCSVHNSERNMALHVRPYRHKTTTTKDTDLAAVVVVVPPGASRKMLTFPAGLEEPEVQFAYGPALVDDKGSTAVQVPESFVWSPPVKLLSLSRCIAPLVLKHVLKTDEADELLRLGIPAARLFNSQPVPHRLTESTPAERFCCLSVQASTDDGSLVVTAGLSAAAPIAISNRLNTMLQYNFLHTYKGVRDGSDSTKVSTSLCSATPKPWSYVVGEYRNTHVCREIPSDDPLKLRLILHSNIKKGITASTDINLLDCVTAGEAVRIGNTDAYVMVGFNDEKRQYTVDVVHGRHLEARLISQPRTLTQMEVFLPSVTIYLAAVTVTKRGPRAGLSTIAQALQGKRFLLENYRELPTSASDEDIVEILQEQEIDVLVVRMVGAYGNFVLNEKHVVSTASLALLEVLDCTNPAASYPIVVRMGPSVVTPDGNGGDSSKMGESSSTAPPTVAKGTVDPSWFGLYMHCGRLRERSRRLSAAGERREDSFLSTMSSEEFCSPISQVTLSIYDLRITCPPISVHLHESLLFTLRTAVEQLTVDMSFSPAQQMSARRTIFPTRMSPTQSSYTCVVHYLHISSLSILLTMTRSGDRQMDPFDGLLSFPTSLVPAVENLQLVLAEVQMQNAAPYSATSLLEAIQQLLWPLYRFQLITQAYRVLGSLELLGNPRALLSGWVRGVKCLLEKREGRTWMDGMRGFFRETTTSTLHSFGVFSRSISQLSSDHRPSTSLTSLPSGPAEQSGGVVSGVITGVGSGVMEMLREPLKGAQKNGVNGFLGGVALGMVELVRRPVFGFFHGVSVTSEFYSRLMGEHTELSDKEARGIACCRNFRSHESTGGAEGVVAREERVEGNVNPDVCLSLPAVEGILTDVPKWRRGDESALKTALARVGVRSIALYTPYKNFVEVTNAVEFGRGIDVALTLLVATQLDRFLEMRESMTASKVVLTGSDVADNAEKAKDAVVAEQLERARNIRNSLGIETMRRYVTNDTFATACTLSELKTHLSQVEMQEVFATLLADVMTKSVERLFHLTGMH